MPAGRPWKRWRTQFAASWNRVIVTSGRKLRSPGATGARGADEEDQTVPENRRTQVFDPRKYSRLVPKLFEHLRKKLGDDVELLHDVHERVPPRDGHATLQGPGTVPAVLSGRPVQPRGLSATSPTCGSRPPLPSRWANCSTVPHEWLPLVTGRLIDFIRVHTSQVGGLSMARKMAAMCEFFNVRTAWHGPGDVSPPGHAANIHLDAAISNFGIQEAREFTQAEQDVFPGCPVIKDGYYWISDRPGFGVDIDEKLAAKFPITDDPPFDLKWGNIRKRDGTIVKP